MSRRSIPAVVVIVFGLVGLVVVDRNATTRSADECAQLADPAACNAPFFSAPQDSWMPAVGVSGSLTGTWFCPGVPATEEDGVGGEFVVSNGGESQMSGRYQILTDAGVVVDEAFTVDAWSQSRIDLAGQADGAAFASAVVEIQGGAGFVEQVARHPLGESVAACSNETSANWYLADGFTVDGSVETLILTNPFDESVVAKLRFSTESGEAEPGQLKGFTVLPRSVRTIPIAELGARDEPIISVAVEARSGRLVLGRAQEYRGGGRAGYDVSLGAPALRDQWWFADGERTEGVTETYSIYNPTDDPVEVSVFFGGLPLSSSAVNDERDALIIPSRRAVIFDPYADPNDDPSADGTADTVPDEGETTETTEVAADEFVDFAEPGAAVPDGRHATVFSTLAQQSIVVERVLTRPLDDEVSTTTVMGALARRPTGYVPSTWHLGVGPSEPTEQALVVYNIDQIDAVVTVFAIGPDGPVAVASLEELDLPSGGILTIDLVDPEALDRELFVTSTSRVFVERLLPRGNGLPGRSGSWLLPSSG